MSLQILLDSLPTCVPFIAALMITAGRFSNPGKISTWHALDHQGLMQAVWHFLPLFFKTLSSFAIGCVQLKTKKHFGSPFRVAKKMSLPKM